MNVRKQIDVLEKNIIRVSFLTVGLIVAIYISITTCDYNRLKEEDIKEGFRKIYRGFKGLFGK